MEQTVMKMMTLVTEQTMALARENSVLGEPVEREGMMVIPVSRLTVGFAGGGADLEDAGRKKSSRPAGGGAKVTRAPAGFLVIADGDVRLVQVEAPQKERGGTVLDTVFRIVKEQLGKKKK